MPWNWKRELFAWGVIAAVFTIIALFGGSLPDQVPSHFDLQGNVDNTMQRGNFLIMIAGLAVGLYLVLTFVPFIDPLWARISSRYHILMLLRDFVMGFVLFMLLLTVFAAPGGRVPLNILGMGLGLMFALMGNYLPKVPRNWFFGIRTPWTLTSDIVWQKSHIVGGWMFTTTGVVTAILSLLGVQLMYALLPSLAVSIIISGFVYPYLLNKRLSQESSDREIERA
jgi:uncharacterized membrane protein